MDNDNDIDEICPQCGGNCGEPGENFGDKGWMPCYHCSATGYVPIQKPEGGDKLDKRQNT